MGKTYDNVEICFSLKLFSLSLYIMLFIVFSQEQEDNNFLLLKKKGEGAHDPKAHMAGANPDFLSMKHA